MVLLDRASTRRRQATHALLVLAVAGCGRDELDDGFGVQPRVASTASGGSLDRPHDDTDTSGSKDTGSGGAPSESKRRHVIIVIGDGMQLAHEVAASRYMYGRDDGLSFHALPVRVFKTTWDVTVYNTWASSLDLPPYAPPSFEPTVGYDPAIGGAQPYPLLPDNPERRSYFVSGPYALSSSTATAMSTGVKTDSDNIAWFPGDPPNGSLETSAELLRRLYGMSIGFVTTGPISHATPAGWFSHNVTRSNVQSIAHQILTNLQPEVVIGGNVESYVDPADVERAKTFGGYVTVQDAPGVDANAAILTAAGTATDEGKKLLGLFAANNGFFQGPVPRRSPGSPGFDAAPPEEPSFANASLAALEVLAQDPDGFFALLEQENIDMANHSNDFSRMVGCVHDLDEAVRAVIEFVDRPSDAVDWSNTTLIVTADHANSYLRLITPLRAGELPEQSSATYPDGTITYGSGSHTNELVAVYVRGRVADRVRSYATVYPGLSDIIDDTSIYRLTLDAAQRF